MKKSMTPEEVSALTARLEKNQGGTGIEAECREAASALRTLLAEKQALEDRLCPYCATPYERETDG